MNYSPRWNLSTIPDIDLRREWARRNGLKGGRKIEPASDKATEEARRKQREYRRQRRAEGKDRR
jgi:cell division inhibitor SulA